MPATAQYETFQCYKTLHAGKPQNDATNKKPDHLGNPNLATNNEIFSMLTRF